MHERLLYLPVCESVKMPKESNIMTKEAIVGDFRRSGAMEGVYTNVAKGGKTRN